MNDFVIHFLNALIETGVFSEKTQVRMMAWMSALNEAKKGE